GGMGGKEVDFTSGGTRDANDDEEDEDEEWRFAVILDGHDSEIKSLAFSPISPYLATCSRDKSVWIWEELEDDNFETVAVLQEHEGDVKCVAWHPSEELLASASYDDEVRLWREDVDDWTCCAVLRGHGGTVWWVEFEGAEMIGLDKEEKDRTKEQRRLLEDRKKAGPRLLTCSDDCTIRVWRRIPKEKKETPTGQGRIPSILKNNSIEEEWVEEARLPQVHERAVYTVSWSRKTGRVVSTGSDGKIVIYEERWREHKQTNGSSANGQDVQMQDQQDSDAQASLSDPPTVTEWIVLAELEAAHDVFEVNHVCWAKRSDKGKRSDDEEIIVSTGDDGEVKVWTLET
ncbi:Cytosolic iron-sulfur protein assembly protein, partial [Elasticomyces elasticus]